MENESVRLEKIVEASYLNVDNTAKYRAVMRCMYYQYEKMNSLLNKEDILNALMPMYPMTMDELTPLLVQLVEWKNLNIVLDHKKVRTIEEYRNRSFMYSMSQFSVEIERMTIKLEKLFVETATLSPSLFQRIHSNIKDIPKIMKKSLKEKNEWWKNLHDDFRRLINNYQDYLNKFNSAESEVLLKSVDFLIYKDTFIDYLKTFIRELQKYKRTIEIELLSFNKEDIDNLLQDVIKSEIEMPRSNSEKTEDIEKKIESEILGRWNSFISWFIDIGSRKSTGSTLLIITGDIIRKIISNAALLINLRNRGQSRKKYYESIMALINSMDNVDDIKILSARLFGAQSLVHYKTIKNKETESTSISVYEEPPSTFELKPITRKYKPRIEKEGFIDNNWEKVKERNNYIEKVEKDRKEVEQYIKNGILDISKIEDPISENVRRTILIWVSQAGLKKEKTGMTNYGKFYKMEIHEGRCNLKCVDGILNMPRYVFKFKEDENGKS